MNRYICIHGHFYQPRRENPWLEAIELQDAAYPYHDWNEKITAECYAPNAISRILDKEEKIALMVNNYAKISFNFGPTLLIWLEENASEVYEAILEADRESQRLFAGHGSALAMVYNHMVMPLANSRDKSTQVIWGIKDFEYRFGRRPEGMWLPETAVDIETLEMLADHGITFTILAPHQASRVRKLGEKGWKDVSGVKIDPAMPYHCQLPSGKTIALFFYDGPISHDVAFGNLLNSGELLAARLMRAFPEQDENPRLVHIATDGETYGHHHRFGDMALAYAIHAIESEDNVRLTNYGEFLEKHPPTHEVEIFENTSWSCVHGIERWRSDCGCNTGGNPGWRQAWRAPLREAFDWLRDTMAPAFEERCRSFINDPWTARNAYIQIILNRSQESMDNFFNGHATRALNESEKISVLKLMELQRHALRMYTSCGWFFDDLSGIETIQLMQYAGRAVQLAQEVFGDSTELQFLEVLERAKSNVPEYGNGRHIYEQHVIPAKVDLKDVGAHYAICSLFEKCSERTSVYCYTVEQRDSRGSEEGRTKLVLGRATVTSKITRESEDLSFSALHWGDHTINCGVKVYRGEEKYKTMINEISASFDTEDFPKIIRLIEKHFGSPLYSLKSLFRDEQRKILNLIMEPAVQDAENEYRQLYEYHAPMMRFLKELKIPMPKVIHASAEIAINAGLRRAFEKRGVTREHIDTLLKEAGAIGISLDADTLEFTFRKTIERMAERLANDPSQLPLIKEIASAVVLADSLPFRVNLWKTQNIFYEMLQDVYGEFRENAERGDKNSLEWLKHFRELGGKLYVSVE